MPKSTSVPELVGATVVGTLVHATTYTQATDRILSWAKARTPAYVCAANVHMVMEAKDDPDFHRIVAGAALVTPDGQPLRWMLGRLGHPLPDRVYGPTLALTVLAAAEVAGVPVGFHGGREDGKEAFIAEIRRRFPRLEVVWHHTPPFRPEIPEEDAATTNAIAASGARLLFVGLGCPKQERWMAAHRDRLAMVQLGVGAFFDFMAGRVRQAPVWMQRCGLEWLYRLICEPRRLWRRYAVHNPRFVWHASMQLLHKDRKRHEP